MKKSRFSDSQILSILKEGESGIAVPDLCRKHGMSNATFYNWRSKSLGSNPVEASHPLLEEIIESILEFRKEAL